MVSVVIPVLNEERYVRDCLASVQAQDYPADLVEIIVADGGSTDATRAIVAAMAADDPRIRLIENPGRNQAAGLNRSIVAAVGEVIARLDAHASWGPSHVTKCVEILDRTGADNVGGTMDAVGSTAIGQAVALATRTRLGAGGAEYRVGRWERAVDTVYLGCFHRRVFDRVGLYDEDLPQHEDYELNGRIRASGGTIVFSPELPTRYAPRETWAGLARQYFRYGRGKVRAAGRTPGLMRPHHLLPPMLTLAILAAPLAALHPRGRRPAIGLTAVYGITCLGGSLRAGSGTPISVRSRLALVFPVLHLSWGLGFWAGLIGRLGMKQERNPSGPYPRDHP
jgi:hypothetical protein